MELNDEQFWQALRHAVKLAEADEAQEMAAAERMLAETTADPASRMSEARIDEVVQFAIAPTAEELSELAAPAASASEPGDDDDETEQSPGRVIPISMPTAASAKRPSWRKRVMAALPKPLAAAAAILLAPQFLAVAAVATAVVVTSAVLQKTRDTLGFQEAVNLLMQEDAPESTRASSQGRIYADLKDSIQIVQDVSRDTSAVATAALTILDDLRRVISQGGPFIPRTFGAPLMALEDQITNSSLDPSVRITAVQQLGEQLTYGLLALKSIEQAAAPAGLKAQNAVWIRSLSEALSQ